MRRKIFDITPHSEKNNAESELFFSERKRKKAPEKTFNKKRIIFSLFLLFIIFVVVFLSINSKAKIDIWPEMKTIEMKTKVNLDISAEKIDIVQLLSPAHTIKINKKISQEFPSSKIKSEKKAKGVIRVYNNYSTATQTFRENTRFMSDSGKVYITPKKIVIPGKPGFLDVEVVAAESGEDYNIGPSSFSIPGLKTTSLYTAFYGKSFQDIKGGSVGEIFEISEEDIDNAKKVLKEKAFKQGREELNKEKLPDVTILEETIQQEVTNVSVLAKPGQNIPSFVVQVETEISALAFNQADLRAFAETFILSKLSADRDIYKESLKLNLSSESIDLEKGEAIMNLDISIATYPSLDVNSIKDITAGKNKEEVPMLIFEKCPLIERSQVELMPFWFQKMPRQIEKIEIELHLD